MNYTIQPGDTLTALAERFLGDAHRWPEIYERNIHVLPQGASLIFPGVKLVIEGGRPPADPIPEEGGETTHSLLRAAADMLEGHGFDGTAAKVRACISQIPNVPIAKR